MSKVYKLETPVDKRIMYDAIVIEETTTEVIPEETKVTVRRISIAQIKQEYTDINAEIAELNARKVELKSMYEKAKYQADKVTAAIK